MSILYKESWIYNQKIFKILKPLFVFLLVVSLELSSFCIVSEVRYGSNQSKIRLEVFRENIQGLISSQDVILCQGISFYTLYAYALQPNRVVFVLEDYSVTEYQTIINNVNPQWILCSENATMVQTLSLNQHLSVRLSDPMGYLMLFKLDS